MNTAILICLGASVLCILSLFCLIRLWATSRQGGLQYLLPIRYLYFIGVCSGVVGVVLLLVKFFMDL